MARRKQDQANAGSRTLSLMAHDLNNALTGILGRAQLALGQSTDERITRHLKIIEQTALDAAQTVLRLQELAHTLKINRVNDSKPQAEGKTSPPTTANQ